MLWQNTEENWKSILRGIEKSQIKYLIASNLLIYPKQPWLTYNLTMVTLSFSTATYFLLTGVMSLYYARNDLLAFVEIAHSYSIVLAIWVLLANHYVFTMPILHRILQAIDADVYVYKTGHAEDEERKLKTTMKYYEMMFQKLFHLAVLAAGVLLTIVAPVLIKMFGSEERKRIAEINYDLPVPMWFPFKTDNMLGFTIAYTFLFSEVFIVIMFIGVAVPFLFYIVFEVNLQYMLLEKSIVNLEIRANALYKKSSNLHSEIIVKSNPLYEKCVRECLKENILHHIAIARLFRLYQDLTSTIYGVVIGLSMIVLATLSLVLTRTKLFSFETVKFTFLFVLELAIVFGYCFMGTSLSEASKKVSSALYDSPWFNLPANQKKTLIIFQLCTKNSIVLKGSGLFEINLQLFVQIVRTTYSIFNIFSSTDY